MGKIIETQCKHYEAPVHPHIRGENKPNEIGLNKIDGSPPHTWGKSYPHRLKFAVSRFTPTYVGKMVDPQQFIDYYTVHPHIRGENYFLTYNKPFRIGSPPHTWGKYMLSKLLRVHSRFTPTYVGKILNVLLFFRDLCQ